MNYLRQVQRGLDYIEAHLDDELEPAAVARHARVSHWHFQRMFKALTNETLKRYIRARRFSRALDALLDSRARIIEIALASGFESQESFTRAFKKAFGVTPAHYRRHGGRFQFLRKLRLDEASLQQLHQRVTLEPVFAEQPALRLVGLTTRYYGVDSDKSNLGRKLPPLWDAFLRRRGEVRQALPGPLFGVIRQTRTGTDELEYTACARVGPDARVPRGMSEVLVPASRYAKFTHRGLPQELHTTVNYIYASWLLRSGLRHTYGPDLEAYGPGYRADSPRSVIDYAIPVAPG